MTDENTDRPVRVPDLEVSEVADGLVVYQASPERVHHLNNTAAFVFELSTGERTTEEITEAMRGAFRLNDPPLEAVVACVRRLRENRLLQ